MNLLIIEGDLFLAQSIRKIFLKKGGIQDIKVVASYKEFFEIFHLIETYDIIITDLALPDRLSAGFDIIKSIRQVTRDTHIIVMSSFSDVDKLRRAFTLGASDYFIKPLRLRELEIRIENWYQNITRTKFFSKENEEIQYHGLTYHISTHTFSYKDTPLSLSKNNKDVLAHLLLEKETIITSEEIKERLWGDTEPSKTRNLRIVILRLKKSLEVFGIADWIRSIHGEGYIFSATPGYSQYCK